MSKRPATDARRALLRRLPSVEHLLSRPDVVSLEQTFGRDAVASAARAVLDAVRADVDSGLDEAALDRAVAALPHSIARTLEREIRPHLRAAINATGIIVHTNLGRAPLSSRAIDAVAAVARGYSNLELDLDTGKRGSRHQHAAHLLSRLFPGHDAIVVNNAAAAVMLALNTFAAGKRVVISRGELVEIGGSFRVPDILERSGARLREVGTTNKTRIADYARAIDSTTGALLRVHPSNFRIVGFTESTPTEELVALGQERNLTVIEDFGSGNLVSLAPYGLPDEPTVADSLASGVHVSIFSGDKLLGGPQAGILVGRPDAVAACRKNPMARALRVDKMTYAALEATLLSFVEGKAFAEVPVLQRIAAPAETIRERAQALVDALANVDTLDLGVEPSTSRVGGGAAADAELPTFVVVASHRTLSPDAVLAALRDRDPPVIGRISEDRLLLDVRTVDPAADVAVRDALRDLE